MAVQMPFAGLLLMHRLVRIRHVSNGEVLVKLHKCRKGMRTFSTGPVRLKEEEDGDRAEPSPLAPTGAGLTSRQIPPVWRRTRRALSPLERISGLLPPDVLSPEVVQLREQEDTHIQVSAVQEECRHEAVPREEDLESHGVSDAAAAMQPDESHTELNLASEEENIKTSSSSSPSSSSPSPSPPPSTLPGESLIGFQELIIAEYRKKGRVEFRKMLQLQPGGRLQSSWGVVLHDSMAGRPAGQSVRTNWGIPILIRRPSLEDYVLFMKRGPAIAYPKDAATMLMMMDVTEGDCVLESGSGSGAMSLFLSRAVGSKGSVLSVEVREDHHRRAVLNYQRWRAAWALRRGDQWPDNVHFHVADLSAASSLLAGRGFHSVALDLVNPHLVLPAVVPHLHPGAVCAVYLANITQVTDLLEGLRCLALPLLCERIIEVPLRDWLVAPALQKDGSYCVRKSPNPEQGEETSGERDTEEKSAEGQPPFGSVPYIARPHPEQMSHTAFLVKLRKCVQ